MERRIRMKRIGGETQKVNTVSSSEGIIHLDQNSLTHFALFVYTVIIHFCIPAVYPFH